MIAVSIVHRADTGQPLQQTFGYLQCCLSFLGYHGIPTDQHRIRSGLADGCQKPFIALAEFLVMEICQKYQGCRTIDLL